MILIPASSSRIRQNGPSLSGSAGSVVQAAGYLVHRSPNDVMFAHQHRADWHRRFASGRGGQGQRGSHRGSYYHRPSLIAGICRAGTERNSLAQGFKNHLRVSRAPIAFKIVNCDDFSGIQFCANFSNRKSIPTLNRSFCHFTLRHRAGWPLRWIGYRANGPVCQWGVLALNRRNWKAIALAHVSMFDFPRLKEAR